MSLAALRWGERGSVRRGKQIHEIRAQFLGGDARELDYAGEFIVIDLSDAGFPPKRSASSNSNFSSELRHRQRRFVVLPEFLK